MLQAYQRAQISQLFPEDINQIISYMHAPKKLERFGTTMGLDSCLQRLRRQ